MITVERYHDICMGHRVYGHENKCSHLHGHNYRFVFKVESENLDNLGRVIDFSVIKSTLCNWLEENWDHKMLLYVNDPLCSALSYSGKELGLVGVPFNPTAENIAEHFLHHVAPLLLTGKGCRLVAVKVWETRKCSATASLNENDDFIF